LIKSQENTSIWLFTHFQFVIIAFAFTVAPQHRRAFYTNIPFLLYSLIIFLILSLMLLCSDSSLAFKDLSYFFSIREGVSAEFRTSALFMVLSNFALCVLWEAAVVNILVKRQMLKWEKRVEEDQDIKWKRKILQSDNLISRIEKLEKRSSPSNHHVIKMSDRLEMGAAMRIAKSFSDMNLAEESKILSNTRSTNLGDSLEFEFDDAENSRRLSIN
jgi:hypothetical protein